jgi:hypothetical protein
MVLLTPFSRFVVFRAFFQPAIKGGLQQYQCDKDTPDPNRVYPSGIGVNNIKNDEKCHHPDKIIFFQKIISFYQKLFEFLFEVCHFSLTV